MMGTSGQQTALLDSMLVLLANPEIFQKHIAELKELQSKVDQAVSLAREEQAKARELIVSHSSREKELLAKISELNLKEASHQSERASLDEYSTGLAARDKALADSVKANDETAKMLAKRESELKNLEGILKVRGDALEQEHNKRMAKLDQREEGLTEREKKLAHDQAGIKTKMDKLKELAS